MGLLSSVDTSLFLPNTILPECGFCPRNRPYRELGAMSCLKNKLTIFILKILFSHVGLWFLICGYMIGGAYLFIWLEEGGVEERYNETKTIALNITYQREDLIDQVIDYCREDSNSSTNENGSVEHIKSLLDAYQQSIIAARNHTAKWGDRAYGGGEPSDSSRWELVSAILFSATILTTIGYGHTAPVTETGYMVCVVYSVFAIPLMSMFLVNVTDAFLVAIRFSYHRGCCYFLERRRQREHVAAHTALYEQEMTFNRGRYRVAPAYSSHRRGSAWAASPDKGNDHRHESDQKRFQVDNLVPASLAFLFWCMYLIGGAIMFKFWDDELSVVSSFYFIVVTLLTIGFGDIVPGLSRMQTLSGKLEVIAITVYIVFGMAMTTASARLVFAAIEEHTRSKRQLLMEKLAAKRAEQKPKPHQLYEHDKADQMSVTPLSN